jgi:DNA-binding transcriptional LysR family regulator
VSVLTVYYGVAAAWRAWWLTAVSIQAWLAGDFMELRYLRYFVAVAELRNFTRAAERLHVAQPAISQQIKTLEAELGTPLLLRDKRSVALTAAGAAFLVEARQILAHAERAAHVAQRAAKGETGRLAIGCFSSAVAGFLPEALAAFRATHPAVRVQLLELTPDQQLRALTEERIELGFSRPLVGEEQARFVAERVYTDRLMVALPTGHRLAAAKSVKLEQLAEEYFVLFQRAEAPALVDQMMALCARAGFAPRVVSDPPMMQTVLLAVASGVGVSLVPGCTRTFRQPGVVIVPLRPAPDALPLVTLRRKGELLPTVAAFTSLLRARLPEIRRTMEGAAAAG